MLTALSDAGNSHRPREAERLAQGRTERLQRRLETLLGASGLKVGVHLLVDLF